VGAGAYSLRLQYRPLIRFIWLGALVMAIGGVITVIGRRQRASALSSKRRAPWAGRRRQSGAAL
jgi:cytochrome c biogenesis factor